MGTELEGEIEFDKAREANGFPANLRRRKLPAAGGVFGGAPQKRRSLAFGNLAHVAVLVNSYINANNSFGRSISCDLRVHGDDSPSRPCVKGPG